MEHKEGWKEIIYSDYFAPLSTLCENAILKDLKPMILLEVSLLPFLI